MVQRTWLTGTKDVTDCCTKDVTVCGTKDVTDCGTKDLTNWLLYKGRDRLLYKGRDWLWNIHWPARRTRQTTSQHVMEAAPPVSAMLLLVLVLVMLWRKALREITTVSDVCSLWHWQRLYTCGAVQSLEFISAVLTGRGVGESSAPSQDFVVVFMTDSSKPRPSLSRFHPSLAASSVRPSDVLGVSVVKASALEVEEPGMNHLFSPVERAPFRPVGPVVNSLVSY